MELQHATNITEATATACRYRQKGRHNMVGDGIVALAAAVLRAYPAKTGSTYQTGGKRLPLICIKASWHFSLYPKDLCRKSAKRSSVGSRLECSRLKEALRILTAIVSSEGSERGLFNGRLAKQRRQPCSTVMVTTKRSFVPAKGRGREVRPSHRRSASPQGRPEAPMNGNCGATRGS